MTQRWDDYLRKPITEEGLAGIRLGDPLNAVLAALGPPRKRRSGKVPAERMEILEYTGVAVIFHDGVVDGVVDGLIAEQPYVGESAEHLRVGMTWRELVGRFPHVYFSERYVWCIP
ncbi:MAG TPA: hypothetical protein VEZ14_07880, partial [Dehalococcoidia bacterium]|nr:hypothetical protein [Dehalococcoidia bacterium]